MKVENWDISKVKPYAKNPRNNDDAVEATANSIKEFGWQQPIVVDKDGVIIVGHTRLKAANKLKLKQVPVTVAENLTGEQVKAYRLADNKTGELAEWDMGLLDDELVGIDDLDMSDFGFTDADLDAALGNDDGEAQDDEFDEEPPEEPTSRLGDIYQLGRHRLMVGDSTDASQVKTLMGGKQADLVLTDPPYGVSVVKDGMVGANFGVAQKGEYAPVKADDSTHTAQAAYEVAKGLCDKLILFGGNYFADFLPSSDGWLIWDKRGESGIRNTFADGEMAWCSFHTPVRIYHQLWNGMIRQGEHDKRIHPTQKPVGVLASIIDDFSDGDDVILDLFGGSGTTLIAAEREGRTCCMMEYETGYVDLIINRWEEFTGKKAVKISE